jgi:hypothetical protein
MKKSHRLVRSNLKLARAIWGGLPRTKLVQLRALVESHSLSVALGDVRFLDSHWYITHSGLLRLARRNRCVGIQVQQVLESCDPSSGRWVFKATVYKSAGSKGFTGYGDADPSNVSSAVHGAEMRVAETRAVNRALRKAYGIGLCSVEELGPFSRFPGTARGDEQSTKPHSQTSSSSGQPRLRDQLCLLIRQHNLDPTLVKAYAADFCGTETLKGASRDLVESFIALIAASAKENRDGLVCKLNSYAQPQEAKS